LCEIDKVVNDDPLKVGFMKMDN